MMNILKRFASLALCLFMMSGAAVADEMDAVTAATQKSSTRSETTVTETTGKKQKKRAHASVSDSQAAEEQQVNERTDPAQQPSVQTNGEQTDEALKTAEQLRLKKNGGKSAKQKKSTSVSGALPTEMEQQAAEAALTAENAAEAGESKAAPSVSEDPEAAGTQKTKKGRPESKQGSGSTAPEKKGTKKVPVRFEFVGIRDDKILVRLNGRMGYLTIVFPEENSDRAAEGISPAETGKDAAE